MASSTITAAVTPIINTEASLESAEPAASLLSKPNPVFTTQPLSPGLSPTSTRFSNIPRYSISPKLPPIQPAHIPKNVNFGSGLMSTNRNPISPQEASLAAEGTSQNPAAVLRNSPGVSRVTDGPLSSTAGAPIAPGISKPATESHISVNNSQPPVVAPIGNNGENVAGDGTSMNVDTSVSSALGTNSPKATMHDASIATDAPGTALENTTTATTTTTPTRPRLANTIEPFPGTFNSPSTPYSPVGPNESRGSMSMADPRASISSAGGSGSRAKHECPNCHQTFTRHHNLKSHLLTHSHEKPFQCQICQSRFRRLHDLKRHAKLHTGERPHECRSCGRKFARGDALARHLRGEGGCAGRRNSMGVAGEDGYDDDMDMDMNDGDEIDDEMPDFQDTPSRSNSIRRTSSLPSSRSRRRSSNRVSSINPQLQQGQFQAPHAPMEHRPSHHSYPPPAPSAFHQTQNPGSISSSTTQTSNSLTSNAMTSTTAASTITSSGLTDSPRALSPSNPNIGLPEGGFSLNRNRSPSFTHVHHQALENNRRRSNPGGSGATANPSIHLPQLNSLPSIGEPHTQPSRQHSSSLPVPGSRAYQSNLPSNDASNAPVGLGNIFSSGEEGIWAYIQNLEKRIRDLEEKNMHMESTVATLTAEKQQHQQQEHAQQQLQNPSTAMPTTATRTNPPDGAQTLSNT